MEILHNALYKIDIKESSVEIPEFSEGENFNNYLNEILVKISAEEGDRDYTFQEGAMTMQNSLKNIIGGVDVTESCKMIADRLLSTEIEAQRKVEHLNVEIQKGILIISHVKISERESKIIISKADYDEFIEEITGNLRSGLPIKKKIFKSFIANISGDNFLGLKTFDTNSKVSMYWWKTFLELDVVRSEIENTKNAFKAIEQDILNPIKKKSKNDYLHLWNATVAYFRTEGEFDFTYYKDDIIGKYIPFEDSLSINELVEKCERLPVKHKFDKKFDKKPDEIRKKFKNVLKLTNEIDLILKHDIPNIKKTFKPHEDLDGKYIMIKSEEGYNYALKNQDKVNNE